MDIKKLNDFSGSSDPDHNPGIEALNDSIYGTVYNTIAPPSGRSLAYEFLHGTATKTHQLSDFRTSNDDTLAKIGLSAPGELLTSETLANLEAARKKREASSTKTEALSKPAFSTPPSELLSGSSVEDTELKTGAFMAKDNPTAFAELVMKNWSSLDLNHNFFVSKEELSTFMQTARGSEQRAMGRFLYSKYDEVKNFYDPWTWQTETAGINEDDINVMAKALDKNAPIDPFRRDKVVNVAFISLAPLITAPMVNLHIGLTACQKLAIVGGTFLVLGIGAGLLATSVIQGSGKNFYKQKKAGIEALLNQTLSPDKVGTKSE